ncbi:hypothetical protein D3C87_1830370 [compost metagenome]
MDVDTGDERKLLDPEDLKDQRGGAGKEKHDASHDGAEGKGPVLHALSLVGPVDIGRAHGCGTLCGQSGSP